MPYLPPETIANYFQSGPGTASLWRAAGQWESLWSELWDLEDKFDRMLVGLTAEWSGPAARQVIEAVTPLRVWLSDFAGKLYATRKQTTRIVSAYSHACCTVISMAVIDANRTQRMQLLANDPLGLNAPTIAQLDQQYERLTIHNGRVWARYSSELSEVSEALSETTPFPPPSVAHNTGLVQPVAPETLVSESV